MILSPGEPATLYANMAPTILTGLSFMNRPVSNPNKFFVFLVSVGILFSLLQGCKHYQLGSPATMEFQSIHVAIVDNDAFVPQIKAQLTTDIRKAFVRDSNLKLRDRAGADAILEVTVVDYSREIAATQSDTSPIRSSSDTQLGQAFEVRLTVEVLLRDRRSGDVLMPVKTLHTSSTALAGGAHSTLVSGADSEYYLLPALSRDLSKIIKDSVVLTW